jgi:hypothetical protein
MISLKKTYIKPILIALISLISLTFLWRNLNQTAAYDSKMFAIENSEDITEFRFTPNNKKTPPLYFKKSQQGWIVYNATDTFPADTANVNMLLFWAMKKLKVQRPVSQTLIKNLSRTMALTATKATFSKNGKDFHSIYVGGSTQDNMATYMYMSQTEQPFIVEIPGFQGYLTPYFNTDIHIWRSLKLIDIPTSEIVSLSVSWPTNPAQNFTIIQNQNELQLFNGLNQKTPANHSLLAGYLILCSEFSREAGSVAGINKSKSAKDSIFQQIPLVSFTYQTSKKKSITLNIYPHQGFEDILVDANPNQTETVQTALFWVKSSEDPHLWLSQDIVLQNRMKRLSDFKL